MDKENSIREDNGANDGPKMSGPNTLLRSSWGRCVQCSPAKVGWDVTDTGRTTIPVDSKSPWRAPGWTRSHMSTCMWAFRSSRAEKLGNSCHVKVSKCKADVSGGPGWGARIYLGPESACDLRFIAFFQIHPFFFYTMMGDLFLLEDLRVGSLQKIVQRQVLGVYWEKVSFSHRASSAFTFPLFF